MEGSSHEARAQGRIVARAGSRCFRAAQHGLAHVVELTVFWRDRLLGLVALAGLVVSAGWLLDVQVLTWWIGRPVSTKPASAILLILFAAGSLTTTARWAQVACGVPMLLVALQHLVWTYVFRAPPPLADWLARDVALADGLIVPGVPSTVELLLACMVSLYLLFDGGCRVVGLSALLLGVAALVGHATAKPSLYYELAAVTPGMTVPTALSVAILGVAYLLPPHRGSPNTKP